MDVSISEISAVAVVAGEDHPVDTASSTDVVPEEVVESISTVDVVAAPVMPLDEQVAFAVKHIKKLSDIEQSTVKQLRRKLSDEYQVDTAGISKEAFVTAVGAVISASQTNDNDNDQLSDEASEEEVNSDSDSDGEFPDDLPEGWKELYGEIVWVYGFKMWYVYISCSHMQTAMVPTYAIL